MSDQFRILVAGREIPFESVKLLRTMDTCADACNVTMPWHPGLDEHLDEITRPFSYNDCEVYINDELQMLGRLYNTAHKKDESGISKELEIFTKTADIIDSTIIPPYEANNIGLLSRCKQQCEKFGIEVKTGDGVNLTVKKTVPIKRALTAREKESFIKKRLSQFGNSTFPVEPIKQEYLSAEDDWKKKYGPSGYKITVGRKTIYQEIRFPRVAARRTDRIFDHLSKLAKQMGYLLSCTIEGDLLIIKPNIDSEPVGTIEENSLIASNYEAKFDGRNRYSYYRAISKSARKSKTAKAGIAEDATVPIARYLTFDAPSTIPGQAQNSAVWRRNKSVADSLNNQLPVNSIYAPNGKLWTPNTTFSLISETMGVKKGFTFLITKVEYEYNNSGITAILKFVPPSAYTTGEVEEPWI